MKKITVIETTVIKTGTSTQGKPWTLYEVTAVNEDGAPIEEKLKSFDQLAGTVEVEVEKTEHEKYGTSFMLKLPKGTPGAAPAPSPGARLGPQVDQLRERVDRLETTVGQLNDHVDRLQTRVGQLIRAVDELTGGKLLPPAPEPTPEPAPKPAPVTF